MTFKEEQKIREMIRSVFKWLYTVSDIEVKDIVEYTKLHATDIMDEAIEEWHNY